MHEETADQDKSNKEGADEGENQPKRPPEKEKHNTSRPLLADRDPEFPYREQLTNYMEFIEMVKRMGVFGLVSEYNTIKTYQRDPLSCVAQTCNLVKNRYKDVKCIDDTRVILNNSDTGDYIHANYIRGYPFINEFLCTQGPLAHTICDFWRMAWDENVGYIVMLCELLEGGKKKCERYIPEKAGQYLEIGGFRVTTLIVRTEDQLLHTELLLEKLGTETDKSLRKIYHWQWKEWPDRGVPVSVALMLRILREVRGSRYKSIVHCSAGVGRTGTLVATEYMLQTIMVRKKGEKMTTMLDMIRHIRSTVDYRTREVPYSIADQRAQLVQTPAQYVYVAKAVIRQLCIACRNPPDLVQLYANFNSELDAFLKTQGGKAG
ncbi:hypothetical protein PMAYCL1PPCAC_23408 [Pristionchus mayeri]|uniref:Tyrosine phosphatase n=1 Tax=Pristionchus mayeri TaxID=1317129 RepID=A0AAN5CYM3_9BILA|nr:hypothetical protein PMAYCL1PPCAC_23408 [Pristionchus mayeri]